jgi:hypothetical protein
MDENPYTSPRSPPPALTKPKVVVGISVLGVLSVPAGAIAASATCTGLTLATQGHGGLLGAGIGFLVAFAIPFVGLVFWNTRGLSIEQIGSLMALMLKHQLFALPLALLTGIVGFFLLYAHAARRNSGAVTELAMFLIGLVVYSIINVGVFISWRHWSERELRRTSEQQSRDPRVPE